MRYRVVPAIARLRRALPLSLENTTNGISGLCASYLAKRPNGCGCSTIVCDNRTSASSGFVVELPLPVSRRHPCHRGDRLPRPSAAPPAGPAAGGPGTGCRSTGPPLRADKLRDQPGRLTPAVAGLRAGTQSGGIHLELLETSRAGPTSARAISLSSASARRALRRMRRRPPTGAILLAAGKSVTMICRSSIDVGTPDARRVVRVRTTSHGASGA
jgi:hypothetical protein